MPTTSFNITFVDNTVVEVKDERFLNVALIKAVHRYITELNPDFKQEDLTMIDVSFWNRNKKRMEYILKDTRFTLGVV